MPIRSPYRSARFAVTPNGQRCPIRRAHRVRAGKAVLGRGKSAFAPSCEAADDVAGSFEAKVVEVGGGEAGGAAVVAERQDLPVEAADVWVAPGAVRVEAPFERGARYVERAGNDAGAAALS